MASVSILKHGTLYATAGLTLLWGSSMVPQTLGLDRYRKILANYTADGKEQPLDDHVVDLREMALYYSGIGPTDELKLQFFNSYGVDPVCKGSVKIKTGAIIGIPHIYAYKTTQDVNPRAFKFGSSPYDLKEVDVESEVGKKFLDSLILSDKAKQFGIAREIKYSLSASPFVDAFLRMFAGYGAICASVFINKKFRLVERASRRVRLGMYTLVCLVSAVTYVGISDFYYCWRDVKADQRAAQISLDYAEGAVEFYTKTLQRNIAQRELMGDTGKSLYTVYGNEATILREPQVKFTTRLENVRKIRDHLKDNPPPVFIRPNDLEDKALGVFQK